MLQPGKKTSEDEDNEEDNDDDDDTVSLDELTDVATNDDD